MCHRRPRLTLPQLHLNAKPCEFLNSPSRLQLKEPSIAYVFVCFAGQTSTGGVPERNEM